MTQYTYNMLACDLQLYSHVTTTAILTAATVVAGGFDGGGGCSGSRLRRPYCGSGGSGDCTATTALDSVGCGDKVIIYSGKNTSLSSYSIYSLEYQTWTRRLRLGGWFLLLLWRPGLTYVSCWWPWPRSMFFGFLQLLVLFTSWILIDVWRVVSYVFLKSFIVMYVINLLNFVFKTLEWLLTAVFLIALSVSSALCC